MNGLVCILIGLFGYFCPNKKLRTKCSKIIESRLAPCTEKDKCKSIAVQPFSNREAFWKAVNETS